MKDKEVYIKARSDSRVHKTSAGNLKLESMDQVLFESEQCQEIGRVIPESMVTEELGIERDPTNITIIRRLTEKDFKQDEQQKEEARQNLCKTSKNRWKGTGWSI
jgi:hypothetical protein